MSDQPEPQKPKDEVIQPHPLAQIIALWIVVAGLWKSVEVLWMILRGLARLIA